MIEISVIIPTYGRPDTAAPRGTRLRTRRLLCLAGTGGGRLHPHNDGATTT